MKKNRKITLRMMVLLALGLTLSACQNGTAGINAAISENESANGTYFEEQPEADKKEEILETEEVVGSEEISDRITVRALDNLGVDGTFLTQTFYGNGMQVCLNFYVNGMDAGSEALGCTFSMWEEETQMYSIPVADTEFQTEPGKASYLLSTPTEDWQISFIENGAEKFVRVSGAGALDGDYFTLEQMTTVPDLFERYMSRADFYPYTAEQLRLLRNEIYAVHGAIFNAEDLKTYFGGKIWYHGAVSTSEFPEELLSDVERANLALIKEIENANGLLIDGADHRDAYAERTDAPYLSCLDQFRETGIHVDMRQAIDMGFYYSVPGEIRVPVTLTWMQIQALENGEDVELGACDPTGAVMMLRKNPNSAQGGRNYLFFEKGTEPDEYCIDANASLDVESGLYTLWYMSDDTIMKTAYEGDIYILKGAVRGDHVSLQWASKEQSELKIPESEEDIWNKEVWSNRVRHDGKGYITAVYYLGD